MSFPQFPALPSGSLLDSKKFDMEIEDPSMSTEMDGGYVVSRAKHTRTPRKTWSCAYTSLPGADKLVLENFWMEVKGRSVIFDWLNPEDGITYAVRFGKDKIRFDYTGVGYTRLWDVTFSLEEA